MIKEFYLSPSKLVIIFQLCLLMQKIFYIKTEKIWLNGVRPMNFRLCDRRGWLFPRNRGVKVAIWPVRSPV